MQQPGISRYTVCDDPTRAAALASEYKAAIKAAVMIAVSPQFASCLQWSKSTYPSLDNPSLIASAEVAGLELMSSNLRQLMFLDDTKATQLERSDGVWPAVERVAQFSGSRRSSVPEPASSSLFSSNELLQVFNEQNPAGTAPSWLTSELLLVGLEAGDYFRAGSRRTE